MSPAPASAVILAGGLGSRMGGQKALRVLRGRTLLQIALDLARSLSDDLIVACGALDFAPIPGVRAAPDDPADSGKGPLAGICAGLAVARHERVLVLACDLPNATEALARELLASLEAHDCAWCRHHADEPLLAALKRDPALKAVNAALAAGRNKVIPVWQSLHSRMISGAELAAFGDPARLFANVNTPQQLANEQTRP